MSNNWTLRPASGVRRETKSLHCALITDLGWLFLLHS